ncbi:FAD-dependent monooxygenase [Nitrospirillum bahiense]|uniref:3-(3-hydroxy-phenyl)propionate hydroxylase n=1 Tax=Nitrospirillum amazonense TaxID=28077 RepID=A0A560F171_9PROT|nr:FAD-dependent monooxygenase [Nitrospirillum amazonense]TWB15354.1 3-(3-hydroxy-phenyl)propionate hydroxylase [Nitrospirillum amazonense]
MDKGTRQDHAVVIAGGGPTGLMLAAELALAGVDAIVVERRPNQDLAGMRAGGLHIRTIEVLDQRGIADRFLALGQTHPVGHFHGPTLDFSDLPTRHRYFLALSQNHIERLLADWAGELGVTILRGCEVTGFTQDEEGVDIALSSGRRLRAGYLVGCDGGRSLVRKEAGIDFPGWDATKSWLIAEAEWREEPEWGFRADATGTHGMGKMDDAGRVRIVLTERELKSGGPPTLSEVRQALIAIYGTDYGIHSPTWISRFTDMARQAAAYRDRRVLLAGDAAHVHPPMGGQGLNIGVQDAVNLGWKLAQVVKGTAPAALLDTYHRERHPVAARVLLITMATVALQRQDDRSKALGQLISEFMAMDAPRQHVAAQISGLAVRYDLGDGHPLLGHRMPDLDLITADGPRRLYTYLHRARPVFLTLGPGAGIDLTPWGGRLQRVDASYDGPWELPAFGPVPAPASVLIRPDGYVAWVGQPDDQDLEEALTAWFGPPGS